MGLVVVEMAASGHLKNLLEPSIWNINLAGSSKENLMLIRCFQTGENLQRHWTTFAKRSWKTRIFNAILMDSLSWYCRNFPITSLCLLDFCCWHSGPTIWACSICLGLSGRRLRSVIRSVEMKLKISAPWQILDYWIVDLHFGCNLPSLLLCLGRMSLWIFGLLWKFGWRSAVLLLLFSRWYSRLIGRSC